MTSAHDQASGPHVPLARRPHGSGDAWVQGPDGRKAWGTFGAAGLLIVHPDHGVLLQHRAQWSHFGGTWGLPGGARHEGESAARAAVREAAEEASVPADAVAPRFASVLDLGWWSYTTLVAVARHGFDPIVTDAESIAVRWVPRDRVASFPLHPGFQASWPRLERDLDVRATLVVDGANVVGSRPDGWWRDRAGAATRLASQLGAVAESGVPGALLGLDHALWWPRIVLVVEGAARSIQGSFGPLEIVRAPDDGDSAIAATATDIVRAGGVATVVTADRELASTSSDGGARVVGPRALLDVLDAADSG